MPYGSGRAFGYGGASAVGGAAGGPLGAIAPYAIDFLGGALGGNQQQQRPGVLHMTSPGGRFLLDKLIEQYSKGSMDFGLGGSLRQGQATLSSMMGARGISPTSGMYQSNLAQMMSNAVSQDAAARRMFGLQLATAGPATATATDLGAEWGQTAKWPLFGGSREFPRATGSPLSRGGARRRNLRGTF